MSDDPHRIYYIPIDADELKKMKEQERDNLHKSRQSYVDAINERRAKSLQYSKDYGETFIKNIVLLNGGSIIAVLTLVGSFYGKGGSYAYIDCYITSKMFSSSIILFWHRIMFFCHCGRLWIFELWLYSRRAHQP